MTDTTGKMNTLTRSLDLIASDRGCLNVIWFTGDGLLRLGNSALMKSEGGREKAERAAAVLASLQSVSRSCSEFCDQPDDVELPWDGTFINLRTHTVLVLHAGENSYLGISIKAGMHQSEVGLIAATAAKSLKDFRGMLATQERKQG